MRKIITIIVLSSMLLFSSIVVQLVGLSDPHMHGFGTDSQGCLYYGRNHRIDVYFEKELVRSINVPKFRTWNFAVIDDTVFVEGSNELYVFDLTGEQIDYASDTSYDKLEQLKQQHNNEYHICFDWIWPHVFDKNDTLIFRAPFIDFYAKFSLYVGVIGGLIAVPLLRKRLT